MACLGEGVACASVGTGKQEKKKEKRIGFGMGKDQEPRAFSEPAPVPHAQTHAFFCLMDLTAFRIAAVSDGQHRRCWSSPKERLLGVPGACAG